MNIDDFLWIDTYVEKIILKHGIYPEEVEQVFRNRPFIQRAERGHIPGEDVYFCFGETDVDRFLFAVFILKPPRTALVITAREMTNKEKKRYRDHKKR